MAALWLSLLCSVHVCYPFSAQWLRRLGVALARVLWPQQGKFWLKLPARKCVSTMFHVYISLCRRQSRDGPCPHTPTRSYTAATCRQKTQVVIEHIDILYIITKSVKTMSMKYCWNTSVSRRFKLDKRTATVIQHARAGWQTLVNIFIKIGNKWINSSSASRCLVDFNLLFQMAWFFSSSNTYFLTKD